MSPSAAARRTCALVLLCCSKERGLRVTDAVIRHGTEAGVIGTCSVNSTCSVKRSFRKHFPESEWRLASYMGGGVLLQMIQSASRHQQFRYCVGFKMNERGIGNPGMVFICHLCVI